MIKAPDVGGLVQQCVYVIYFEFINRNKDVFGKSSNF